MREDWIEIELGNVLHTTSGGTPSRRNPDYYSGSIPWVKSGELNQNTILETEEYISEDAVKNSSAKIFPKGTLLIALYGATIGKLAFLGIMATTNQAVCGIFENDAVKSKFLYYFLLHNRRKLVEQGAGGAQPNISQTILKNLPIVIAPLPEQRAIVRRIAELLSELDNSISNLKSAQAKLTIYRQAVLKKALEGGFTSNQNLEADLPENWIKEKLDAIAKWGSGGTPSRSNPDFYGGKIPWLKTGELGSKYVLDAEEKITEEAIKRSSAKIFPSGSVGIAMYGATIGKTSIFKADLATNQACAVAQPYEICKNEFLYYFLISIYRKLVSLGQGGAQPNISQTILKDIEIKLPPPLEQIQIVQEIESRLSVADKLGETIQTNLLKSESLRQSILKKAFEGKLLSEAELAVCRREADWEPAERLMERIKKEKVLTKK